MLSACVSSDRVTLLTHSDGGPVGSLAVLDEERGDTVLDAVNQQALLSNGRARTRQLTEANPEYAELIDSLPAASSPLVLTNFPTGDFSLSAEQIASIRQHLSGLNSRPGYQIEVRGYTDSTGIEHEVDANGQARGNRQLSQVRADQVAAIIRAEGFEIADEDAVGMSEFEARRINGDEVADPLFRRVEVVIR